MCMPTLFSLLLLCVFDKATICITYFNFIVIEYILYHMVQIGPFVVVRQPLLKYVLVHPNLEYWFYLDRGTGMIRQDRWC